MHKRNHRVLKLFATLILLLSFTTIYAYAAPIDEVRDIIAKHYVDEVALEDIQGETVEALLDAIDDPYAAYFTNEEYQAFLDTINCRFYGIGIYIETTSEGVLVSSVMPDTPAERAGLLTGDVIIEAAGQSLIGLTSAQTANIIRNYEGDKIHLRAVRDEETLDFYVEREDISQPTVVGELRSNGVGYVQLISFGDDTYERLNTVMAELKEKGAYVWVVDIRNNSGGYLTTVLQIASMFVGDGAVMRWHDRESVTLLKGDYEGAVITEPVLLLVNDYSASASEILAAALKDYYCAVLIGDTTYGKGSAQDMYRLTNGDVLKLTIARFLSPEGNRIEGKGVKPHIDTGNGNALVAAELLLEESADTTDADYFKIDVPNGRFMVPVDKVQLPDYWAAWQQVINGLGNNTLFLPVQEDSWLHSFAEDGWLRASEGQMQALSKLYYPYYRQMPQRVISGKDKLVTIKFNSTIDFASISSESMEFISVATGKRVKARLTKRNRRAVDVWPLEQLVKGQEYWLVAHDSICRTSGEKLLQGFVTPIHVDDR